MIHDSLRISRYIRGAIDVNIDRYTHKGYKKRSFRSSSSQSNSRNSGSYSALI